MRKGTFALVVLRQQASGGRVLRSELLGPRSPALFSNGHRRKRWLHRGVARKRRSGRRAVFEVSVCGALAAPQSLAPKGLSRLAALVILLREGKGARPKKHARSERRFDVHCGKEPRGGEARESDARECVRASESQLQKSLGGSLDPEKRRSAFRVNSARRGDGQGRGSSFR